MNNRAQHPILIIALFLARCQGCGDIASGLCDNRQRDWENIMPHQTNWEEFRCYDFVCDDCDHGIWAREPVCRACYKTLKFEAELDELRAEEHEEEDVHATVW